MWRFLFLSFGYNRVHLCMYPVFCKSVFGIMRNPNCGISFFLEWAFYLRCVSFGGGSNCFFCILAFSVYVCVGVCLCVYGRSNRPVYLSRGKCIREDAYIIKVMKLRSGWEMRPGWLSDVASELGCSLGGNCSLTPLSRGWKVLSRRSLVYSVTTDNNISGSLTVSDHCTCVCVTILPCSTSSRLSYLPYATMRCLGNRNRKLVIQQGSI